MTTSSSENNNSSTVVHPPVGSGTTYTTPATMTMNLVNMNHPLDFGTLSLKPKLDNLSDNATLLAVYCFIKNFIGASGASTVAIDNKIEQAMDLVKSHLMFAVREEVEVLKEKISELMDRINQLEYENNILRAHASPDTLNMLTNQQPPKIQAPTSTTS